MGQVDALKMVDHLRTRLVDLAVSENHVRDRKLSDAMRRVWEGLGEDGGLVSELWVEGVFTPELSKDSLQELSEEGLFPLDLCLHLNDRGRFPGGPMAVQPPKRVASQSLCGKRRRKTDSCNHSRNGSWKNGGFSSSHAVRSLGHA